MNPPPTRDEVLAVVKRYLIEVIEGLTEQDIDLQRSIADSGANSLEIVEVISCSMRDLGVSIPRDELGHLTWARFFTHNLVPVTIGNVIGGAVMVGLVYCFVYRPPAAVAPPGN